MVFSHRGRRLNDTGRSTDILDCGRLVNGMDRDDSVNDLKIGSLLT